MLLGRSNHRSTRRPRPRAVLAQQDGDRDRPTASGKAVVDEYERAEGEPRKETEEEAAARMKAELERKAKEAGQKLEEGKELFDVGQRAYRRGMYDRAVSFLEAANDKVPKGSGLGGEVQVWLAMAYDADGRREEGLALYKKLEGTHPLKNIRRQAGGLRFIMEAPKLKIGKDEMVEIPLIGADAASGKKTFSQLAQEKRSRARYKKIKPSYLDQIEWHPPRGWQRNPYFWVALTIWLTVIGVSMAFGD